MDEPTEPVRRKRGRPPGVRNKPKAEIVEAPAVVQAKKTVERMVAPSSVPMDDYRHADPAALVARLYSMCDWASQCLMNEMKVGIGAKEGMRISALDIEKLVDVGNSLEKALSSHKRAIDILEKLKGSKTPEELLEIAIQKIEGQSLATLSATIKRLRDKRKTFAPLRAGEDKQIEDSTMETAMLEAMEDL